MSSGRNNGKNDHQCIHNVAVCAMVPWSTLKQVDLDEPSWTLYSTWTNLGRRNHFWESLGESYNPPKIGHWRHDKGWKWLLDKSKPKIEISSELLVSITRKMPQFPTFLRSPYTVGTHRESFIPKRSQLLPQWSVSTSSLTAFANPIFANVLQTNFHQNGRIGSFGPRHYWGLE